MFCSERVCLNSETGAAEGGGGGGVQLKVIRAWEINHQRSMYCTIYTLAKRCRLDPSNCCPLTEDFRSELTFEERQEIVSADRGVQALGRTN